MNKISDYTVDVNDSGSLVSLCNIKVSLTGYSVEQVYELPNLGYLFFTTNNSPYEEVLYIIIADKKGNVIDQAELFKAYTPGHLKDVEFKNDNLLYFTFWEGVKHQLMIRKFSFLKFNRLFPGNGCYYNKKFTIGYLLLSLRAEK